MIIHAVRKPRRVVVDVLDLEHNQATSCEWPRGRVGGPSAATPVVIGRDVQTVRGNWFVERPNERNNARRRINAECTGRKSASWLQVK